VARGGRAWGRRPLGASRRRGERGGTTTALAGASILRVVSLFAVVLLIAAATLLVAAEWTRIQQRVGVDARKSRDRERRKRSLRIVHPEPESDPDEFQRAVERDLAALPTIDDRDARNGKNR